MQPLNRRRMLGLIAVTAGGGAFMSPAAFAQTASASTALLMPDANVCVLTPATTEGPFYFDPELDREDITEGRDGLSLIVRLQVVDPQCQPIAGARVDIWHADAEGIYSGYPGQGDDRSLDMSGEKFLRGNRLADRSGIVAFRTVYPGWYSGRTAHIHFKVILNDADVLTGQMFFPDDFSEHVYTTLAPYTGRAGKRDMLNRDDRIAVAAGPAAHAAVREGADAYEALMIVGVRAG